jgi:Skp family chaperone for outer membrane proteins
MELIEYVKLFTAFIVSIGGASVVVVALAKWFGGFLSNRLLDSYNNKHERELETLKNKYANELEKTKAELEKTKAELEKTKLLFARYSEKQFDLYNDLW